MEYPRIIIKPAKESSILRKHPWVFSGAIKAIDGNPAEGDIVEIAANKGRHLGFGHFQNGSIAVRMLTFGNEIYSADFFDRKILSAFRLREQLNLTANPATSMYRLVHGEGDGLPGLIIDFYSGHLVIQCHSIGMFKSLELIVTALKNVLGSQVKSIHTKSGGTLPKNYSGEDPDKHLFGEIIITAECIEYEQKFLVDLLGGQKTGFFLDQRENRHALSKFCRGKKILNTFCYTGGFSVYALHGGAREVHSVDSSRPALDYTEKNIVLATGTKEKHTCIQADVMEFIRTIEPDFDVIVLDPPAFAKNQHARHNAVQGYKRLNAHAIRQVKPGGIIFTFSCSQVIDPPLFTHTVISAAMAENRNVRILQHLGQPADHPVSAFHPEGEYLKGLIIQVE